MGIDVDAQKVVTFNATRESKFVTDLTPPIPRVRYGPLEVVSIFRLQTTLHDADDGNPLIYALEGKVGHPMPSLSAPWVSSLN